MITTKNKRQQHTLNDMFLLAECEPLRLMP
jgi:hypothetical protein